MARRRQTTTGLASRRGNLILALAIVAIAIAAIVNVPDRLRTDKWVKRDLAAWQRWVDDHGGRAMWGRPYPDDFGSVETHSRYDVICFTHYPNPPSKHADYKMYLLVDSHHKPRAQVVLAQRGPLRPKPTTTGPKCGEGPAPPR